MAEKIVFDPNAYCSGHLSGLGDHPDIAAFPDNFVTEALALGAELSKTPGGFVTAGYLFKDPQAFVTLPALEEQPPILRVLEQIKNSPPERRRLLKVNGPYSILASLAEPALFYRWLSKNPQQLHCGLEKITTGLIAYIRQAFSLGVEILSLADPYANPAILGEQRCREFACAYLVKLLKGIIEGEEFQGRIINLCPHNSLALEKFGLVKHETLRLESDVDESYLHLLLRAGKTKGIRIAGHQCIYTEKTRELIRLSL
jgi:uroporphyrinogen-III decarboxylase